MIGAPCSRAGILFAKGQNSVKMYPLRNFLIEGRSVRKAPHGYTPSDPHTGRYSPHNPRPGRWQVIAVGLIRHHPARACAPQIDARIAIRTARWPAAAPWPQLGRDLLATILLPN